MAYFKLWQLYANSTLCVVHTCMHMHSPLISVTSLLPHGTSRLLLWLYKRCQCVLPQLCMQYKSARQETFRFLEERW